MFRLFKRIARVSCWRETVPKDPTLFVSELVPGTAIDITDLRIQFQINKSLPRGKRHRAPPNTCDITISNLASKTRADLETKPLFVQLDAGYDDVPRMIFVGDLRFGMTKLVGTDWETLLQLGDADCHYRWARLNKSYPAGTKVRDIVRDTAGSMGMEMPPELEQDRELDAKISYGSTAHGPARDYLSHVLSPYGYTWSFQDNRLQILRERDVKNTLPIPIDEEHGMIGTPEFGSAPRSGKPPHMTVRTLLYPQISPGALVRLTSKVKSGDFKVEQVRHRGDSHGEVWESEFELKPLG